MTKVIVEFFKISGKHNFKEEFESLHEPFEGDKISREVKEKFEASKYNYHTIEVEKGEMWNKWLILN